jgi:hypothetical protein
MAPFTRDRHRFRLRRVEEEVMTLAKKILGVSIVLAGYSIGMVAFARATDPTSHATVLAHHTGHESRTAADCSHLPGNVPPAENPPPPSNMRYWCTECVNQGGQHYHPDCPAGSRCSPNNGQAQCGGGRF